MSNLGGRDMRTMPLDSITYYGATEVYGKGGKIGAPVCRI